MAPPAVVQLTDTQFKPGATGSLTKAPSAADGPRLATVMVYELVLPASRELTPLVLAMVSVVSGNMLVVTVELLLAEFESVDGATGDKVATFVKVEIAVVTVTLAVTVTLQTAPGATVVYVPLTTVRPLTTDEAVLH